MTKLETITYYNAIRAANRLITIDSDESKQYIINAITDKKSQADLGTIHIEVFHNDENTISYSLVKAESDRYDLWFEKQRIMSYAPIKDIGTYIFDNLPKPPVSPYNKYIADCHGNLLTIKSFSDKDYERKLYSYDIPTDIDMDILGYDIYENDELTCQIVNPENEIKAKPLIDLTMNIKDESIRLFAQTCIKVLPDYVYDVPASILFDLHSASDLADQGLVRFIVNAVNLLIEMTNADYAKIKFTQHEIDMMIVATMFCKSLKYGWQNEYNRNPIIKDNYHELAADLIRSIKNIISENEINFIANCIESHRDNHDESPSPDTEYKYMVYLANYIAGLKSISFTPDDTVYVLDSQKIVNVEEFKIISENEKIVIENAINFVNEEIIADITTKNEKMNDFLTNLKNNNDADEIPFDEILKTWNLIKSSGKIKESQKEFMDLAKEINKY